MDKLAKAQVNPFSYSTNSNPWSGIDKLELGEKEYKQIVDSCRFFYRKDPIASSTINKLVEIGINDLLLSKNKLSDNEFRIFTSIKPMLIEFAEQMALEYLVSGLVVPEITYTRVTKDKLEELGIKKYESLILPTSMWIRNPDTIKIKPTILSSEPTYVYKIPSDVVYFVQNNGKYPDGTEDPDLWNELKTYYGDFITAVKKGKREFVLDNDLIFRRKPTSNDPYPIPYLFPALENLRHKRNLRRMDYSIAARVISAIQLFKLGDKDYPVTEDNAQEQFDAIRQQIYYRESPNLDIERIFQLFANHTLTIEWVYPDTQALLNEQKYESINQDIIYALGFPSILITGESKRTGSSDPQYAMMSPAKTMENFRTKILTVIKSVIHQIAIKNNLKSEPITKFKPLRLFDYATLAKSLADLYNSGNLSRTTYSEEFGYDWVDETDHREEEQKVLMDKQLGEFAPKPFSNQPTGGNQEQPMDPKNMDPNKMMDTQENNPGNTNKKSNI